MFVPTGDRVEREAGRATGWRTPSGKLWTDVMDEYAEFFDAIAPLGTEGSTENFLATADWLEEHADEIGAEFQAMLQVRRTTDG